MVGRALDGCEGKTVSFCADCLSENVPLVPRPLGRDGGNVLLCGACDPGDAKPARRKGKPVYRGYDIPDRDPGRGSTLDRFRHAADRVAPSTTPRVRWSGGVTSPGFIPVCVLRRRGPHRGRAERARETLRGEPWFAELRYLGSDARFHVFERPDVALARRVRSETNVDPIAALRRAIEEGKR